MAMFHELHDSVVAWQRDKHLPVYVNVDMHSGTAVNTWVDSLSAFFPALGVSRRGER